jgi:predicted RNase H-like nuclease (RuvC/YqgF family)
MNDIISNRLKKKKKMRINLDWLVIDGNVMKELIEESEEEKMKKEKKDLNKKEFVLINEMKNFLRKQGNKSEHNIFFIKKLNPNVLTQVN